METPNWYQNSAQEKSNCGKTTFLLWASKKTVLALETDYKEVHTLAYSRHSRCKEALACKKQCKRSYSVQFHVFHVDDCV